MAGSMTAIVKVRKGFGNFEKRTVPIPTIGPEDVLVKVKAVSMSDTDQHVYNWMSWVEDKTEPPVVVGHEFCGTVVEIGTQVSNVKVGDFVSAESRIACGTCPFCRDQQSHLCPSTKTLGVGRDGAWADFVSIPARNIWLNPPDLPLEIAAIQESFGNAAHAALAQELDGRNVLITGCGPIGLMACAIARASGAESIIATDPIRFRRELALKLGASQAFDSNSPDLLHSVLEKTEWHGVDVFLEMSGSLKAIEQGLTLTRRGGQVTLTGFSNEDIKLNLWGDIISKGIKVYGVLGCLDLPKWEYLRSMLHNGTINLKPVITDTRTRGEHATIHYPLRLVDDFEWGFTCLAAGQCGKVVFLTENKNAPGQMGVSGNISSETSSEPLEGHFYNVEHSQQQVLSRINNTQLVIMDIEAEQLRSLILAHYATLGIYRNRLAFPLLPAPEEADLKLKIEALEKEIEPKVVRLNQLEAILKGK